MAGSQRILSDGTHNGKIQTYHNFLTMLSSYKIADDDVLQTMIKNDDMKQKRRIIRKLQPKQNGKRSTHGNDLTILADFFDQN